MLKIKVDSNDLRRWLNIAKKVNRKAPLEKASDLAVAITKSRIRRGINPDYQPFAPLAPSTLKRKKGAGILRETDKMFNSISAKFTSANKITMVVDDPGVYHQYGTKRMPKREIFGFSAEDGKNIEKIFSDHQEKINRS